MAVEPTSQARMAHLQQQKTTMQQARAMEMPQCRLLNYHAIGVSTDTAALARLPQDGPVSHLLSVTEDCSPSTLL